MKHADDLNQDDALLQQITQAVLNNLDNEQFGVEDLSEQIGISRSHLHRKLKLLKGKSVSQFIREVRLEEAMKLLNNNVATTSEIAYRVGFNSPSYSTNAFKNIMDIRKPYCGWAVLTKSILRTYKLKKRVKIATFNGKV